MAKAYKLRQVDEEYKLHKLAFLNLSVQATKKNGKYVYKKFKKFFDYDKQLSKAKSGDNKQLSGISEYFKKKKGGK